MHLAKLSRTTAMRRWTQKPTSRQMQMYKLASEKVVGRNL
jgi:hypothetical protein